MKTKNTSVLSLGGKNALDGGVARVRVSQSRPNIFKKLQILDKKLRWYDFNKERPTARLYPIMGKLEKLDEKRKELRKIRKQYAQ